MTKPQLLLISDKSDKELYQVSQPWMQQYGDVRLIGKFWKKPDVGNAEVSIYGGQTFSLVLAQLLNIELISPKDEMIADVDLKFTKRHIEILTVEKIDALKFPVFIKSVVPKQFKAAIYTSKKSFLKAIEGLDKTTTLIVSEILTIEKEARVFILNQTIQDAAFYEGEGKIDDVFSFVNDFLKSTSLHLPITYVLDVGFNEDLGWFILEFNASWGAGLNNCKADKVLKCIQTASKIMV